jgi:dTDP-4-amino-4,6-dideoxygalactose transaminase
MIPIFNLTRTHAPLKKALAKTFKDVLEGSNFVLGENVKAFEKEFSSYIGADYGVGVGSGTEALSLTLQAVGVKSGDKVIIPANSYPTVFAVTAIGAVPRPVDVTPNTYLINPDGIESVLKKEKIKAVIVVHMYGQPADIQTIVKITKKYSVPLIEDCAHAHGAPVGTYGEAS